MSRRLRGLVTVAIAIALGAATSLTATAPALAAEAPADSCWTDVSTDRSLCVPDGTDLFAAVHDEFGITLVLPADAATSNPDEARRLADLGAFPATSPAAQPAPLTATILALLYQDINYGTPTFVVSSSTVSTCSGTVFTYSSLGAYGWNDRVSSVDGFSNCLVTLYENDGFGGSHIGPTGGLSSLGSMNDKASSVRVATS